MNGRRAVYIPVTKRPDASTIDRRQRGEGEPARFQALVPDDITVSYELDQSGNVSNALSAVCAKACSARC